VRLATRDHGNELTEKRDWLDRIRRLAFDQRISLETNVEKAASNREIVRRAFDAWATGTGSPFDLLAEDAQWTIVGRSEVAPYF
jgi:hypothetical protein